MLTKGRNLVFYLVFLLLHYSNGSYPSGNKAKIDAYKLRNQEKTLNRELWWHDQRRELSAPETAILAEEECKEEQYDVAVYIEKHVYVAGIPRQQASSCPLLVMEASDPAWTDEHQSGPGVLQKHIHEVSFPTFVDPKKHFDLFPVGTFSLSQLLRSYEEATAVPEEQEFVFSHGPTVLSNYDLVLANCGELAVQIIHNLGFKSTSHLKNYAVRRLLSTYGGIADEVRSNENVIQLAMARPDGEYDTSELSDDALIRRLVEHRFRRLSADEEDVQELQGSPAGMPCGKWYSKDCIGDTDIRYASDASDNLADQANLWRVLPGYYEADSFVLGPDGDKIQPSFVDARVSGRVASAEGVLDEEGEGAYVGFPYSYDGVKLFLNITVIGSRYLEHLYQVFPPAPEEFCNETIPEGMTNVAGSGQCGINGFSIGSDRYGTSSYERDGSLEFLPFVATSTSPDVKLEAFVSTPVNDQTGFASVSMDGILYQHSMACFDPSCKGMSLVIEAFNVSDPVNASLIQTTRVKARRINTGDEFIDRINQVYDDFNVLPEQQFPAPMTSPDGQPKCLAGICPDEFVWCESDPKCSASPYQEPAGSLKPGIYILIVLVVLALNSMVFAYAATRLIKKRETALKEKFAIRIAESIKVEGEDRVLTAENIAEEFKKIDVDGSGMVNKSELFDFIQTGKAGKIISESDFESLFAAIDLDKNGEIDFGEFVTFFQKCQDKYEEVKDQPAVRQNRMSHAIREMK